MELLHACVYLGVLVYGTLQHLFLNLPMYLPSVSSCPRFLNLLSVLADGGSGVFLPPPFPLLGDLPRSFLSPLLGLSFSDPACRVHFQHYVYALGKKHYKQRQCMKWVLILKYGWTALATLLEIVPFFHFLSSWGLFAWVPAVSIWEV